MSAQKILPGTGRGTATRSGVVEGARILAQRRWDAPSTTSPRGSGGPPPRAGEDLR